MFFYIFLIPVFLSAMASLRAFRKNWPWPYRSFSLFLFVVLFVEIFAVLWTAWLHAQFPVAYNAHNGWIYNPFMIIEYLFYVFFFLRVLHLKKLQRKMLTLFAFLFTVWSILNMLLVQGISRLNTYSLLVSSLMVVYLSISYFLQLLRDRKIITLTKQPMFWIATGAFFYHLCSIPYFIFLNYTARTNLDLAISLSKIMAVLNWIMYSSYTIAFLCRKNFQQSPR